MIDPLRYLRLRRGTSGMTPGCNLRSRGKPRLRSPQLQSDREDVPGCVLRPARLWHCAAPQSTVGVGVLDRNLWKMSQLRPLALLTAQRLFSQHSMAADFEKLRTSGPDDFQADTLLQECAWRGFAFKVLRYIQAGHAWVEHTLCNCRPAAHAMKTIPMPVTSVPAGREGAGPMGVSPACNTSNVCAMGFRKPYMLRVSKLRNRHRSSIHGDMQPCQFLSLLKMSNS